MCAGLMAAVLVGEDLKSYLESVREGMGFFTPRSVSFFSVKNKELSFLKGTSSAIPPREPLAALDDKYGLEAALGWAPNAD